MSTKSLNGLDANGKAITSVGTPSNTDDAATKAYVDSRALPTGTQGQSVAYGASGVPAAVTPPWGGGDYFRSGNYSHGLYASTTGTASQTLNSMRLRPFVVPVRRAFDRIGINVTTGGGAGTGAVLRMGIYGTTAGMPGSLIVDAGTVAAETTGSKEVTISQTLDPGIYWIALVAQVATCTVTTYGTSLGHPFASWSISGTSAPNALTLTCFTQPSVTGALPSTAAPTQDAQMPAVCLRAS